MERGQVISAVADKATDAIGIIAIAWLATHGFASYEPYAAIVSLALGKRYIEGKIA